MRLAPLLLVALASCASVEIPPAVPPVSAGLVRIRTFTEPSAALAIHPLGAFVLVVTPDGIERWDRDGNVLEISATHGLPSNELLAVTSDPARARLWISMPGVLGRYDATTDVYDELPPPGDKAPWFGALRTGDAVTMSPARTQGVWIGTARGLLRADDDGWLEVPLDEPVQHLADTAEGLLYATPSGLWLRRATGELTALGPEQGLHVSSVTRVLPAPALGGTLVIGRDESHATRLAVGAGNTWHTYRVLPNVELSHAALDADGVLLTGGNAIYRLTARAQREVRPLARDGVRLSAMRGGPELELLATPLQPPASPTCLAVSDEHVLVGTRDIGVARYGSGEVRPHSWLRRQRMFSSASTLSVACHSPTDCWLATGARSAWHWTGDRFSAGGPDEVVLAVVRDRAGFVLALHREARDAVIRMSRVDSAGRWSAVPRVSLATPGKDPEVSFARVAASGALWVGLRHREGPELRTWGIAIVDVASGRVQYHRALTEDELRAGERVPRDGGAMMPVPRGIADADVRGDAAWVATDRGVARLSKSAITTWDASSGLRSDVVRAIAVSRNDTVYAATSIGIGRFANGRWSFPSPLGFEVNDLALTSGGQLWMATRRGIAAYDGVKVRRVDVRRGLVENHIQDIAVDRYDRIWARGPGSLALISPVDPATKRRAAPAIRPVSGR